MHLMGIESPKVLLRSPPAVFAALDAPDGDQNHLMMLAMKAALTFSIQPLYRFDPVQRTTNLPFLAALRAIDEPSEETRAPKFDLAIAISHLSQLKNNGGKQTEDVERGDQYQRWPKGPTKKTPKELQREALLQSMGGSSISFLELRLSSCKFVTKSEHRGRSNPLLSLSLAMILSPSLGNMKRASGVARIHTDG
jgi:hypothetical protein